MNQFIKTLLFVILAGSLKAAPVLEQPILFVARQQYAPDHHNTETFFQRDELNTKSYRPGGALKVFDPKTKKVRTLVDAGPNGLIRDPEVSYDGKKIIFSMRKNIRDDTHIYEVKADGTGLRQLTFAKGVSDIDPLYLPDGGILFVSTREPKYCMCNRHIMGNLFRMEADGANIHQIGKSTLHEGNPTVLDDGRILYDRWEYVDRNFGDGQALWTVNPDGTQHAIFWGSNLSSPGAVIDGRAVPGTPYCLAVFCACHDRPWGALALIDRRKGVNSRESVVRTWPASAIDRFDTGGFDEYHYVQPKYEDPYPLDEKHFLVSRMVRPHTEQMGIYLVDMDGNETLVHAELPGCFNPMPLAPRPRPPVIPPRRDWKNGPGRFYVQDVYIGTHMDGIERGSVKWLRVVESPEKRSWTRPDWGGQGAEAPAMNWRNFENKRILGTVPVEPDGSAYFEVPSDRFVFFQLLDANGMMVQSMRSGTIIQSGETQGCVGCHENRTAGLVPSAATQAMRRSPDKLTGWHGPAREFSFMAEVQPVFNQHCVRCHDFKKPAGKDLVLAPDRDAFFNAAYEELCGKKLIHCIGAGPAEIQTPKTWGSHASRLIEVVRRGHQGVQLSPEELDRLITWIDLNGPYYPTYLCAYPENLTGRCPIPKPQLKQLADLTGIDLYDKRFYGALHHPWLSFDRPELSPILDYIPDKNSAAYKKALEIIRTGAKQLQQTPRADMPGFVPCAIDAARDAKYRRRADIEAANREAIREGKKMYDKP